MMTDYAAPPELVALLKRHEGVRLKPYKDIVGKVTIGIGRNLDDVGISAVEAEYLLANDIEVAAHQAAGVVGDAVWAELDPVRQCAVIDMCFNIGAKRLEGFVGLLAALRAKDWQRAHDEALNSKWAAQVGGRAVDIATMLLNGQWPA